MLVDVPWLAANAAYPGVSVVELDVSTANYDSGHIPGAVLWNAYSDLRGPDYIPVDNAGLEDLLSRSDVTPDSTLIFYGSAAGLGIWLMLAYGHMDVRILRGPREQWTDAGHSWSLDVPDPVAGEYDLPAVDTDMLVDRAAVEAALSDSETVILDVRTEEEFSGETFWPSGETTDAGRAGHIPGAVNVPISLIAEDGLPKAPGVVRAQLDSAGVTPDKRVIVYSTMGLRASLAWFTMKYMLDFPEVSVYYGSWVEWGKASDTPVETTT